jgi:hypothetical protein
MGGVITMPQPSARNHRNNPYFFDEMFVRASAPPPGSSGGSAPR